jgi:DNA polymerase (family X)
MMPVQNSEVARLLNRLADLLEIEGANPFRLRAYRNAARLVEELPHAVASMIESGADLTELPGIGVDLAAKIATIVGTGRLPQLEEVEARIPAGLMDLTGLAGLGPKRIHALHQALGITGLQDLEQAARAGKVRGLEGFGEKTETKILQEIERRAATPQRTRRVEAEAIAAPLVQELKTIRGVGDVVIAGSYRRRKETVGDLDILVTCRKGTPVMDRFLAHGEVREVLSRGDTRSSVRLRSGLQIDLRVVPKASHGAALHYFTGSKEHNIAVRQRGVRRELKINEYGVFRGERRVAGRTEEEVYRAVGLPYIDPELREGRGEIEAAEAGRLPRPIPIGAIRGDLHSHTTETDGRFSLEEMVRAARERGYQYLAITDHTKHLTVARGMDATRLARQIEAIDRLNAAQPGFRILKSAEIDILEDGSLDLPDDILRELDLRVCSVHYKFDLPRQRQTERILRAMDNPYFNILAHPTGRLIGQRPPYEVDLERIMDAALQRGCFLEVNAQPERLDLDDVHCRMAKERGLKVAVSTDAHSLRNLDAMRLGLDQARRGWLEPDDILNTRGWDELRALLRR